MYSLKMCIPVSWIGSASFKAGENDYMCSGYLCLTVLALQQRTVKGRQAAAFAAFGGVTKRGILKKKFHDFSGEDGNNASCS